MNRKNILRGLSAVAVTLALAACSDNYLDVLPTTNESQESIGRDVQKARLAINGMCNSMQTQYQSTNLNQYNGESYVNTLLGDACGPDYVSGLGLAGWGNENLKMSWGNNGQWYTQLVWDYCYNIINQANVVLEGIDEAEGTASEINFIKAQALTFRAYFYTKLVQWYAPRWEDSNGGQTPCVVLRLKPGVDGIPLSTMAETLDQIYSDLDTAIECYKNSTETRETKWQPDLSIAYGTYARAALIRNDWAKAQSMAHDARQGYEIMSNDTYLSGFVDDNNDFMWEQAMDESSIYYWSFGSHYAPNGIYTQNWNLGAGAISMDLVRELDPNDIRLQCFITPDKINVMNAQNLNKAKVKDEYFWDKQLIDLNNNLNLATGFTNALDKTSSGRYGLYNFALNYIVYYVDNIYKGNLEYTENNGFYCYYEISSSEGATILNKTDAAGKSLRGKMVCTPFGAHLKFMSCPPYGTSCYPFMRASEMCLAEAEAAWHAGDYATAKSCLMEINGKRIPNYAFSGSNDDLLNEIRLCRRIELWGEGQSWTDWKRWNLPLVRHKWVENDVNSGNWPVSLDTDISNVPSEDNCYWRMPIPQGEIDYNDKVDNVLFPM